MSPIQNDAPTEAPVHDEQAVDEAPVELELIEEISIDGMCGVY